MELFYYCYKAPKGEREESENYQKLYQPDYISEKEALVEETKEEVPPTYSTLNDSIKDVEAELEPYIPQLLLPEPESELEPVKEELEEDQVEIGYGKVDDTILLNTDYREEKKLSAKKRTFKRPKWAKKDKKSFLHAPAPQPGVLPEPAPEGANEDELGEISVDPISLDSLTEKVKQKDEELASNDSANEAAVARLQSSIAHYQTMVNEQRELVEQLQRDNANIMDRLQHTERANGVSKHDSYLEVEKTKAAYQTQQAELALFSERLRNAEARYQDSEHSRAQLQAKLDESNQTINHLNGKIDLLSESINNIREKYHVVSEDNIELSTKTQEHERKLLEADQHNKNLIHMVTKKDDALEAQQVSGRVSLESLRSHAASSNNFYDCEHSSDSRFKDPYVNGFLDKDKSLTTRHGHSRHHLDPFGSSFLYPPYHPMAYPDVPPVLPGAGMSDPRQFDPYFMSRLRYEQMMRSRSDFYHQMFEKDKASSLRSVPLSHHERERVPSTRSERIPQYSVPFTTKSDHRLTVDSNSNSDIGSKLSDTLGYERVESRASIPPSIPPYLEVEEIDDILVDSGTKKSSSITSSSADKYFSSPKTMIKTDSLTDLEHLVDNCILPDQGDTVFPEGKYTENIHNPLGGKYTIGHANGAVNGTNDTESESSSSNLLNVKKPKNKSSFFSRGKHKSKKKAEAAG